MTKVKIIGAGSIGNHLANACRCRGFDTTIVDIDQEALERTKSMIYPSRYGQWDENIKLQLSSDANSGDFDLIFIGTPPDSHLSLALQAVKEKPKAVIIEKPLCGMDMQDIPRLREEAQKHNVRLFIGYDHAVSTSFTAFFAALERVKADIHTLDVNFREYWGGIFEAHPWLDGPSDSYLGYYKRGGGSLAEHSHGLHLYLYLCDALELGEVAQVTATIDYYEDEQVCYDKISLLQLETTKGFIGRCAQDVVTVPVQKSISVIAGQDTYSLSFSKDCDTYAVNNDVANHFTKTRPDDFIAEIDHLVTSIENNVKSPLDFDYGVKVMDVIDASHRSAKTKTTILL